MRSLISQFQKIIRLDGRRPSDVGYLVTRTACGAILALSATCSLAAAQDASSTQQKLANPIASLTLVPIQVNYDRGIGPSDDGYRVNTLVEPVVPFKLNSDLNLVVRTIIPIVGQDEIFPRAGSQFGLGDTLQSFFLVPPTANGFTWGAGPALQWRTGTDDLLTSGKWALGPTIVALQQTGPWTVGILANHIWSFAGDNNRDEVNQTYLQPFITYAASGGITYAQNTESTFFWEASEWSVPINAQVQKLTKLCDQPVQLQAGLRYWAEAPDTGAEGLGGRLGITFILE
jgi:hypothetical protein